MKAETILKFIRGRLLFALAFAVFLISISALAISATLLVAVIGSVIGIGQDIFIYAILIVAYWKAWDAVAWVIGKIAERQERKEVREYYKALTDKLNRE